MTVLQGVDLTDAPARRKPRLAFIGTGWIGRDRMRRLVESDEIEAVAICDSDPQCLRQALAIAPDVEIVATMDEALALKPDGVVIATPNAFHAGQSRAALAQKVAVFCQKPLGRDVAEIRLVLQAAREADRLLGVDLSYRHVEGARRIRQLVAEGALGRIFAIDLTFHNAYGPDRAWFHDAAQSGGGCLLDLAVHLVDLALWLLDQPRAEVIGSALRRKGRKLAESAQVEDYASATLETGDGVCIRLATSWHLHAGRDAEIGVDVYGTDGAATLRNVNGSFHDFEARHMRGTSSAVLASGPDPWGGGACLEWAARLATSPTYRDEIESQLEVARILDAIYGRSAVPREEMA